MVFFYVLRFFMLGSFGNFAIQIIVSCIFPGLISPLKSKMLNSSIISEVITGIFYRPTLVFLRLKESRPGALWFFLIAGLPFIALGALGRAYSASLALSDTGELLLLLFIIHFVSFIITFLSGAFLISKLAPRFSSIPTPGQTLVLVITSYIPFMAALAISSLFPDSALIRFIGLTYTILVFGKGSGIILETPPAKIIGFTMIAFLILFAGNYVLNLLLEFIFLPQPTL